MRLKIKLCVQFPMCLHHDQQKQMCVQLLDSVSALAQDSTGLQNCPGQSSGSSQECYPHHFRHTRDERCWCRQVHLNEAMGTRPSAAGGGLFSQGKGEGDALRFPLFPPQFPRPSVPPDDSLTPSTPVPPQGCPQHDRYCCLRALDQGKKSCFAP